MREFHVNQSPEAHYTVYKLTSPSGKIYIGCTGMQLKKRWKKGKGYNNNISLREDIEKFGWDSFSKEIVCEKLVKEGAEKIEKQLIERLESCDPQKGYNMFSGGPRRGATLSEEGIAHVSKGQKAAFEKNPSLKKRMSALRIKMFSENPAYAASISASCKKTRSTPEYRAALSERAKNYFKRTGKKPHKEAIAVMCIETGVKYPSMRAAERATGIDHRSISYVCNGIKYTAGALHWKFV